jgi:hypothetical protein
MVGIYPPLEILRGQLCSAVSTLTYFLNFHLIFNHVKISTFRQQSGYGLDGMKARSFLDGCHLDEIVNNSIEIEFPLKMVVQNQLQLFSIYRIEKCVSV